MWLEAIFSREDVEGIAERFSPLRLRLRDGRGLVLLAPRDVSLVPEEGIALTCDATLHWPFLGFDLPISLRGLLARVAPTIEQRANGATLVFRVQIDHAGVAMLPAALDQTIAERINRELCRKHVELAWNFVETLSHSFALPAGLASAAAFSIRAIAGAVKVTEAALALAVDFEASVKTRPPDPPRECPIC